MSKNKKVSVLLVFIAVFFCCFVNNVDAAEEKPKTNCLFCEGDKETYKQEQQFMERIKLIKSIPVIKNSIDEVALAATVLHKQNYYEAIASRYDENFKKNKSQYKKAFTDTFKNKKTAVANNLQSYQSGYENKSNEDKDRAKEVQNGAQVDLLNAAAIIMADSAGWGGRYNEKKYQEALAGDKLVGNNNGAGSDAYNAVFCAAGSVFDTIFSAGNITYQFLTGQDVLTETERTSQRFYNMTKICQNGYVGGVYDITPETEPDPDIRKAKKEEVAKEIIDLVHYYRKLTGSKEECVVNVPAGDYANWKQCGASWSGVSLGGSSSICGIGCLATSVAIQIARSGTQITNLPSGYDSFNPGAFVESLNSHGGFVGGGNFAWTGQSDIAPNWIYGSSVSTNVSNTALLARILSEELSSPAEGKYQKFIVLQISSSITSQHWVAVDTVSGDNVTIFDPGASGNTLDDNYSGWVVHSYRTMYATDVLEGKTGSSTSSTSVITPANPSSFKNKMQDGFQHGDLPKDSVKYIMMHDTESGTDDAEAIANAWGNGPVASHFIVDKNGTIYQTVPIDKIAHHAGWAPTGSNDAFGISQERDDMVGADTNGQDYAMNAWSIGIEIVHDHDGSEYPEEQLKALDKLVAYIDKEIGDEPIITDHKEWTGNASQTKVKKQGQLKQDVDSSFPLSMYKNTRTHDGNSADACGNVDGLSTDLGEGQVFDIPTIVPAYDGGTMPQSGIIFDDVETFNYAATSWGYDCATVRSAWFAAGSQSEGYIATLDNRYLVAISVDIAHTGDAVDIVLENGEVIKAILADEKGPGRVSMYGHNQYGGVSLVEFEGVPGYTGPNATAAHPTWAGQPVVKIINYGRYPKIN